MESALILQSETRESVMTIPVFPETKIALKGRTGLIVGIANDQSFPSLQRDPGLRKYGNCHDALSCFGLEEECRFHSSDNVCWAIMSSSSVGTM